MKPQEITFKADKKHRDKYFSAGSFAHPAKMMLPLQRWIIEKYSKPGDVILDPMAGQGTLLIACTMGRHVICVELESKFVQMQNDNWTKIQTLGPEMGYEMGMAIILQGDARKLPDVLADVVVTSPPYANQATGDKGGGIDWSKSNKPITPGRVSSLCKEYSSSQDNIGNLPYGNIDCVITSPPYEGSDVSQTHMTSDQRGDPSNPNYRPSWKTKLEQGYAETKRPYVDCVITSPPYEASLDKNKEAFEVMRLKGGASNAKKMRYEQAKEYAEIDKTYSQLDENIGNLKGDSYLSAMLEVYQGCRRVLAPQGLMCLVTKNFIRDKQEIRLDLDTIKLCEQAGLQFVERHYRKLTSQSFWRTIYQQKYPDAPILDKEDILVFRKYGV